MKELMFLKELILIGQINKKNVKCKGNDHKIHFWYMSKNDAIKLLNNSVLDNKGVL